MTAAVLQMAVLAAARIEQRSQSVRRVGRGRRRHPVPPEDAVANLEVQLALEVHIAGRQGEGVGGRSRAARSGAAAGLVLARLGLGEVGGRGEQVADRRGRVFAIGRDRAGDERQSSAENHRAGKQPDSCPVRRGVLRRLTCENAETLAGCVQASFVRKLCWCVPPRPLRPFGQPRCRRAGRCIGNPAGSTNPA